MSGGGDTGREPLSARVRRSKFSLIWLIPVVAFAIAAYLGVRALRSEGPEITITFNTGDGLVAGQTQVRHKAVQLGQVEGVRLSDDLKSVLVKVKMRRDAEPYLTENARFWVVRPRLSSGSISGIETLISGSYIEMDPGTRKGAEKTQFVGLEQPPGVRSGEPGRVFKLKAESIGSLGQGSPVFYRDIPVGEVLGYDIGNGLGPVTVSIFVRAPYDEFVREGTHFWNASGLSVNLGSTGVHVEVASLQALLAGGIAFSVPREGQPDKAAASNAEFKLYANADDARSAGYKTRQVFVTYFESSVRGLAQGSPVEFFGIQVGVVTEVELEFDPKGANARIKVTFEVQPGRLDNPEIAAADPIAVSKRLVARGMRAQLQTSNFLTGSLVLGLGFVPNAPPAEVEVHGDVAVIPSAGGGLDNILASLTSISNKLEQVPLDQIGANLNDTLRSASGALGSIQDLAKKADSGLSPVFQRLPAITGALQDAATRATRTFGSLEAGYGRESQFNRELERSLAQVGDAARSIRLLADFLDRHPEALVRGRAGSGR